MKLRPFRDQVAEADKPQYRPEPVRRVPELAPRPIHTKAQPRMWSLQLPSFTDRK